MSANATWKLVKPVLDHYPAWVGSGNVQALDAAGGFSGVRIWKVASSGGDFCLRQWPREHPTFEKLKWIHATLRHLVQNSISYVPSPIVGVNGNSITTHQGDLWQLEPWLPGSANFHDELSDVRLQNALTAVARLHLVAATSPAGPRMQQTSPGILERRERVRQLLQGEAQALANAMRHPLWPAGFERGMELIALFQQAGPVVAAKLDTAARLVVPCQPCIRDLWHDHILFTGEKVTGIIDFGALRGDNITTDLARLIGSLVQDDEHSWNTALEAYTALRPLSSDEYLLLQAFDQSGTLLSGLSWLQWIFQEKRHFADREKIIRRLDVNLARLRHLIHRQSTA